MLITQGKTNWKFLLIVIVLAVVIWGAITHFEKIEQVTNHTIELMKINYVATKAMEETQRRKDEAPTVFEKLPIPEDWTLYKQGHWTIAYPSDFEIKDLTLPDFPNEKALLFQGEFDGRKKGVKIISGLISDKVVGNLIEVAKRDGGFGNLDAILCVQRIGVGMSPEDEPPKIVRDGKILVGDLLGTEFLTQDYDGSFMLNTTFEKNSRIVDITTFPKSIESNDSLMEIYNTMISSFKFIEEDETADWETYRNEEYGFELILPEGWEFSYREEFRSEDGTPSIVFNFVPPGEPSNILWGSLYLTVYPYQPDINKWIEKYLPDFENELVIEEINRVGNKPTFLLDRKEGFWIPWHVILGNEYSYYYGFSQDGAPYFVERIIEEIFPHINIK